MITVKSCHIYPLKSGAGISVPELKLSPEGPEGDRRYMLVQAEGPNIGKFMSQRDRGCEKMALIITQQNNEGIQFTLPQGDTLKLAGNADGLIKDVRIWKDELQGLDMGDQAADFFSTYLDTPCRLIKMSDAFNRSVSAKYAQEDLVVSFADSSPLLITNQASLEALKPYISEGITIDMERFRANIVLEGLGAFEEDVIYTCQIGDAVLEFVEPCARCKITTIKQETGVQTANEPIATLAKMRRGNANGLKGVFFGQDAITRKLGTIKVGDTVEILERRAMHPAVAQSKLKFTP